MNTGTIEDEINLRQFVVMKGEAWKDQVEFFLKGAHNEFPLKMFL